MKKPTGIEVYGDDEEGLGFSDNEEGILDSESEFDEEFEDEQDVLDFEAEEEKPKKKKKKAEPQAKAESSDESDEFDEELYKRRTAWGKDFYGGEEAADDDEDIGSEQSEDEKALEAEAVYLQEKRMKRLRHEDFGLDFLPEAEEDAEGQEAPDQRTQEDELEEIARGMEFGRVEKVSSRDLSKMTDKERRKVLLKESKELPALLKSMRDRLEEVQSSWQPLHQSQNAKLTDTGRKYVAIKYQLVLNYLMNVSFYLAMKSKNTSVTAHPVLDRIMQARDLFDQLKPIDESCEDDLVDVLIGDSDSEEEEEEEEMAEEVSEVRKVVPLSEKVKRVMAARTQPEEKELPAAADQDLDDLLRMPGTLKRKVAADPSLPALEPSATKIARHLNVAKMTLNNAMQGAKSADTYVEFRDKARKVDESDKIHGQYDEPQEEDLNEAEPEPEKDEEEMERLRVRAEKKAEKKKNKILSKLPKNEDEVDGARQITHEILKNKGLTRKRKKLDRNARVKNRFKYDKAMKKQKSMVQQMRAGRDDGGYDGEATGVRKNLKKSTKLT